MNDTSIFSAINDKYNIVDVAKDLGIRVKRIGGTFRANSIDISGRGENALALYEHTNSWYDFMLNIGGDITALVAHVKFNGDTKQAIRFLMPDANFAAIDQELKKRNQFNDNINRWHQCLINPNTDYARRALDYLHNRRINDDTIKTLKIGVMPDNSSTGGFRIIFPYWNDSGDTVLYFTSRRYDWSGRGEDEKQPKYKKASLEQYPFLRNVPMGLNSLYRKKDDTLIITEGVIDWTVCFQEGYSVLSPNGGDFGKMWKEVLEKVKPFKRVVLAFDSDKAGQEFTYKAAKVLLTHKIPFYCTNLLTKDVAEHYEAAGNLDAVMASLVQGKRWLLSYITPNTPFEELSVGEREKAMSECKEFIMSVAPFTDNADTHALILSLRKYFPEDWVKALFEMARKGPSQAEIADKVRAQHNLLFNPRTGFYEYQRPERGGADKGIWKAVDDETIQGYIKNLLGKFATGGKLSSICKLVQADGSIHSDTPIYEFNSQPLMSLHNGTLHIDMNNGQFSLLPHSMYDYSTVKIPIFFNEKAQCPTWLKFLDDITNGNSGDQAVLQEFAGYLAAPHCKFQKALMLKGGGSNGKSIFLNVISALLGGIGKDGRGYVSTTEPAKWAKDFRLMPLRNSWVNISSDAENDMRGAEGIFKKVVAGEILEDSYKFRDAIPFKTRAKVIMACNYFPTVNDTSDGFMRRWLIVELPMHFVEKDKVRPNTNDRELDPFLEDKLMKELPGILLWMLEGLQRLIKQKGFTRTRNQDRLINEFRAVNNPLYTFIEDKEETFRGSDNGHIVERDTVFCEFSEWAKKHDVLPIPANRFYSNIQSVFNNLSIPFSEDGSRWIFFYKEDQDIDEE